MPRRWLKRNLPTPTQVRENRRLRQVFGTLLHDSNLWHLNRLSVTRAVIAGMLMAWVPVPFQMVLSAGLAIAWRCNMPVAIACVWITNPLTMGPMFYGAYKLGALVLGLPVQEMEFEISWNWLQTQLGAIWEPFLLGCAICGVVMATVAAIIVHVGWRIHVAWSWKKRIRCRAARSQN